MSKSPTQKEKVLKALIDADGEWVSGTYFLRGLYLSQFHARIFELQEDGYQIESSEFTDEHGFKSYRLLPRVLVNDCGNYGCDKGENFARHARNCPLYQQLALV